MLTRLIGFFGPEFGPENTSLLSSKFEPQGGHGTLRAMLYSIETRPALERPIGAQHLHELTDLLEGNSRARGSLVNVLLLRKHVLHAFPRERVLRLRFAKIAAVNRLAEHAGQALAHTFSGRIVRLVQVLQPNATGPALEDDIPFTFAIGILPIFDSTYLRMTPVRPSLSFRNLMCTS